MSRHILTAEAEGSVPSSPTGTATLIVDTSTKKLATVDDTGAIVNYGPANYNIQWALGDGSNTIVTGSTTQGFPWLEVPAASVVDSWAVTADATGSITVNILKSTYAGFPPASPLAGLGQPILTNLRKNTGNATGTASLAANDYLQAQVVSVATVKLVNVALRLRKT